MAIILPFQEALRPVLPLVFGCKDYQDEKLLLERVDLILIASGLERRFLELSMERWEQNVARIIAAGEQVQSGIAAQERYQRHSRRALRCAILINLLGMSYREMSKTLAHAPLYRWFCGIEDFDQIRVPGKSTLADYMRWLDNDEMHEVLVALTRALASQEQARLIGLENELDFGVVSVDTTCLEVNIHFPTDWVLLRDGIGTTVKCIQTIRRHGLKRRIPAPEGFLKEVNGLAMAMSGASRRKAGSKKARKAILRKLKAISKVVESHGRRYYQLLDEHWEESDLSRKEAEVILRRLNNVLKQLPASRRQAHERIIGERKVPNAEKILSLYEPDIHVIVRGKAGAEVEFGNSLFLAETVEGFIIDHELKDEISRGDAQWLLERYPIIKARVGQALHGVVADRGFESKKTRRMLEVDEVFSGLCPRDPRELSKRMAEDEVFAAVMSGRGRTEGRIGILKNVFLQKVPRSKGFEHRQLQVAWAVLSHNLWVVARLRWAKTEDQLAEAA
jgi:hypothetical protein